MPLLQEDDDLGHHDVRVDVDGAGTDNGFARNTFSTDSPNIARRSLSRRLSEESIRTELCEGPVPESPFCGPSTPEKTASHNVSVSDRAELIERLKRGESPTWVPNRHLESLFLENKTLSSNSPRTPHTPGSMSPGLLPPPTLTPEKKDEKWAEPVIEATLREGSNIERPRSALHSGNFTPQELSPGPGDKGVSDRGDVAHFEPTNTSWIGTSPPRDFNPFHFSSGTDYRRDIFGTPGASSLSSSRSSNFIYKPPTSPLVQSESNDEVDLTLPLNSFNIASDSPRGHSRRHTLNFSHASSPFNISGHRQAPLRREGSHPYQAHQPRRSVNSTPILSLATSSPQTPVPFGLRRPSISSDASPLHHASLVGSYEESILKGRMSTNPSKPLDFMAQIGVLGLGKCKPSLRCPSHVTLPFSAVFYNYSNTSHGRSKTDDGPSPYVGQIDLENGLTNSDEDKRAKRKLQWRYQEQRKDHAEEDHEYMGNVSDEGKGSNQQRPKQRRSKSPKVPLGPPGGRYRIPEKGQLQIIIKNQNKTAVKLFLVPYDLAGMEAGTKTFIRQRSYSAGPIMDIPTVTLSSSSSMDKPTLRYLIHLHICCPSKGRFYLYKAIRVVFANRVPDGKEKLRNEITWPDPRFAPYKPVRVIHPHSSLSRNVDEHHEFRRRSLGYSLGQLQQGCVSASLDSSNSAATSDIMMSGLEMIGTTASTTPNLYDKLSKGDKGYGGNPFMSSATTSATVTPTSSGGGTTPLAGTGLLSQKLRSLDAPPPCGPPSTDTA
ncbi:hypothetical protein QBC38DRAFT_61874 [Podospora fimiseda]|uniref:Atos-like conserved domain-containing protein n=1 Tax=Podospora fimiseda TaxID=252190 RepID=A0AAN7BUY9_9PEZI|nr:hypothetical protein QBC38DRAFT_61874 [Podospora fimiseda]